MGARAGWVAGWALAWGIAAPAAPAASAPQYRPVQLPDLGAGSIARAGGVAGGVFGAAGDVNGDGVSQPGLWLPKGRRWQLFTLPHLGHGGSASALFTGANDGSLLGLVAGTVRDSQGTDIAAVWRVERTRRGVTSTVYPLTPPGGLGSEAYSFLGGDPDRPIIAGCRSTAVPGVYEAALWEISPISWLITEFALPALGSAEALTGTVLPGGLVRVLGCAELTPASGLEFAGEWVLDLNDEDQFPLFNPFPFPAPGLDEYHVLAADPLLRFAVGARFAPGPTVEAQGWRSSPATTGAFEPLSFPSIPGAMTHLFAVNGLGRALGAADHPLADDLAFTYKFTGSDEEPGALVSVRGLCNNEQLAEVTLQFITQDRVIGGAFSLGNGRRAGLLAPTGLELPDAGVVFEGQGFLDEYVEDGLENLLFRQDGFEVGISAPDVSDWLSLKLNIDISHWGAADIDLKELLVTARLNGPKGDRAKQEVCLWSYQQQKYILVSSLLHRGGKPQTLRHRLPANLAPFRSSTGSLRIALRWNGAGLPHSAPGYSVLVDQVGIAKR